MKDKTCAAATGRALLDGNGHLDHHWRGASSGSRGRRRRASPPSLLSLSRPESFTVTFSAQGCPISVQQRLEKAS